MCPRGVKKVRKSYTYIPRPDQTFFSSKNDKTYKVVILNELLPETKASKTTTITTNDYDH
jgi:hypothetical protein